jgi:ABC-type nitrate/sulfonate/bicarbonate transport system substrate-binding protein
MSYFRTDFSKRPATALEPVLQTHPVKTEHVPGAAAKAHECDVGAHRISRRKLVLGSGLALSAMLPMPAIAAPVTLRFGVIAASAHLFQSTPIYLAQRKGMLDRQGIKLELVPLPGVGTMIKALDDGTVDISNTAMPYLIQGVLKGSDAVAVVGGPANTIYSLVAKPQFKSFEDLQGKTIGLSLPVDIISIGTRKLLARHGLQSSDYLTRQLIGTPRRVKCLEEGDCAATPLEQPEDILLARKGYHILGNSHEVIPTMQFTVIAARRSWVTQNQDVVTRFARGMGEAYQYMADPANRDEVIDLAASTTGTPRDVTAQIYRLYYDPYIGALPLHAEISVPGVAEVIRLLGEAGVLHAPLPPAEKFVDLRFLAAAGMQQV